MRFYYLTITFFLQTLGLIAQSADAVKLSSEQISLIQNQGSEGIQSVFKELEIEIQDLTSVESFAMEAVSCQLTSSSTKANIADIASSLTGVLSEIALSKNTPVNYVIEYASAGIARGMSNASENNNLELSQVIMAASEATVESAFQISKDTGTNIDENVSAVGSGYLAGTIEATNNNGLNVVESVIASSSGLIIGAINAALKNNFEVYETLASTCEGVAEAAVEASVREQLDLIKQIGAASLGAGESAVKAATANSLNKDLIQKSILKGLKRGTLDSIPGKGHNVRIMIAPQKNIDSYDLIKNIENGIFKGGIAAGFIPIIETPFIEDTTLRIISPVN